MKLRALRSPVNPTQAELFTEQDWVEQITVHSRWQRWQHSIRNGRSRPHWRADFFSLFPPDWTDADVMSVAEVWPLFELFEVEVPEDFVATLPQL